MTISCRRCLAVIDAEDNYCRRCGLSTRGGEAWYHSPAFVILMLFVIIGPLAIPLLWRSPRFSTTAKWAITVVNVVYTLLMLYALKEAYLKLTGLADIFQDPAFR